jgi:hypothetical protein
VNSLRLIIINMKDYMFADAAALALQNDRGNDFTVEKVYEPEEIEPYVKAAYAVVMEVTCTGPYTLEERLELTGRLRTENSDCKVVFLVDENTDAELARRVRQAKKEGLIDNFIYGSVSAAYLSAVIDTL